MNRIAPRSFCGARETAQDRARALPSIAKRPGAIALIALAALSFGCGKMEHSSRSGAAGTHDRAAEKQLALPAEFPKDVPILEGATLKLAMSQGDRIVVHLATKSSIADAAKFYDEELKRQGWTIQSTSKGGDMFVVSAKKGSSLCGVTVTKDTKGTLVRLAVSQGKK
jgi:hypothetical protein